MVLRTDAKREDWKQIWKEKKKAKLRSKFSREGFKNRLDKQLSQRM